MKNLYKLNKEKTQDFYLMMYYLLGAMVFTFLICTSIYDWKWIMYCLFSILVVTMISWSIYDDISKRRERINKERFYLEKMITMANILTPKQRKLLLEK